MNEQLKSQLNHLSGFVLIVFPVVLLIDDLYPSEVLPVKFMVGLCAAWFIGATIIALARLLWTYRPRAVIAAGALALAGIFGSVGIMVFRFVTQTIRQTEGAIANLALFDSAIGKTQPFIFNFGLITALVLCFLAGMLLRFERKAKWAWAVVCLGALLFPAGRILLGTTVVLLSDALLLVGLGYVGWQMLFSKRDMLPKESYNSAA